MTSKLSLGLVVAAGALAASVTAGAGTAKDHGLSAAMTAQQVVTVKGAPRPVPKDLAKAKGSFSGTISSDMKSLKWKVTYDKLADPHLVAADIHIGKSGQWGPILVRLCAPCKSGQSGTAKLKSGYGQRLLNRAHWVTLITDKYPNGAVRGQVNVG